MKHFIIHSVLPLLLLISFSLSAQNDNVLRVKSGNYVLEPNISEIKTEHLDAVKYQGNYYVYVHFTEVPSNTKKEELLAAGVELMDYVPDYVFMAKISENVNLSSLSEFHMDGVYLVLPEFKMHYNLATENYPEHALNGDRIKLVVQNHAGISSAEMDMYYQSLDGSILGHYSFSHLTTIEIPINRIQQLASHPLVKYIEPIDPEAEPEDVLGQSNHRSGYISNTAINTVPFNGAGVWLAVGDDGQMGPHIDYSGRLDQTSASASVGTHGDHVTGIMMGAGNLDPEARGMAWAADVKVYDVYDAIYNTPTSYYNPGVVVTSVSYGSGCNTGYTTFAQTADQQVRTMPNLMHIFSAGNSGTSDCGYGAGAGWGNITGGVKVGKNVMAIGNVDYTDALSSSSSRGPASDGRIKPDICANGSFVWSCQPNNTYASFSGTSMSAPGASGTYGQLVHAYRTMNSGTTPPSALVKGAMLNCADDLGNVGPDFKYGWGRLNARRVVEVFQNNTYILGSISQNGSNSHNIPIPANVKQVKIMVYWNDYEGSTVTTKALVNDLDMTVTTPASSTLFPYILDPTPIAANLDLPATNGVDTLNNMEQVVIDNPASGTYTVNVDGTLIPQGPQSYYVIYEIITSDIVVTYPAGGESFAPSTLETIRWDAVSGTNTFSVEYSTNNGGTWTTISNTVAADVRYYNWTVPNIVSGQAKIRVIRNGVSGQSQLGFNIIGIPANLAVDYSCTNSFRLSWDAVSGATEYEVSILGAKYMDSLTTVSTTSAVFTGYDTTTVQWLSVRAKASGISGERAIAVQKIPGTYNCPQPNDIEVTALSPSGNAFFNCVDYSNAPVTVQLQNVGTGSITNVNLAFQFDAGTIFSGQYVGTILPGNSVEYTFSQTINYNTLGAHQLLVWNSVPDDNPTNDMVNNQFEMYSGTTVTLPYTQDFESFSSCGATSDCGLTVCPLGLGWLNLTNGGWDDIDFRIYFGGTPSPGTGADVDHNPGTNVGKYLYLEASSGCSNSEAQLISPCIDITNAIAPVATIWYHMLGTDMGELHFDVFSNGKWYNDFISVISGNQGSNWQQAELNLTQFAGNKVNVRFRASTGPSWSSDVTIDDFQVTDIASERIFITEYARHTSPSFSYLEIFNSTGTDVDLSGSKIACAGDNTTVIDLGTDVTGSLTVPAYGFLVLGSNSTQANFETAWGTTLGTNVNYNNSLLAEFSANNTFKLRNGGTVNVDDGVLIDETTISAVAQTRVFQLPIGKWTNNSDTASQRATPGSFFGFENLADVKLAFADGSWYSAQGYPYSQPSSLTGDAIAVVARGDATFANGSVLASLVIWPNAGTSISNEEVTVINSITIANDGSLAISGSGSVNCANKISVKRNGFNGTTDYNIWGSPFSTLISIPSVFSSNNPCDIYVLQASDQSWKRDYTVGSSITCLGTPSIIASADVINVSEGNPDGNFDTGRGYFIGGSSESAYEFTKLANSSLNNGTLSVNIYGSNGAIVSGSNDWNLLSNPYPSSISASSFLTANTPIISNAVYVYNPSTGMNINSSFDTYNSTDAFHIASCQGFYVDANTTSNGLIGTASFTNSMRTNQNNDFRSSDSFTGIYLKVNYGTGKVDKMRLYFDDDCLDTWDAKYDANKMENSTVNFSSKIGDRNVVFNGLPLLTDQTKVVPLYFNTSISSNFSIGLDSLIGDFSEKEILLEDRFLRKFEDLSVNNYSFNSEAKEWKNRFYLHIIQKTDDSPTGIDEVSFSGLQVFATNDEIIVTSLNDNITILNVDLLSISGQQILSLQVNSTIQRIDSSPLAKGIYLVKSQLSNGQVSINKVMVR